jgi:hypothetical protein
VGGHARLRQPGDPGQFGDGKFLDVQQRQQAQSGGVPEQAAVAPDRVELDDYILLSRLKDISKG